MATKALKYLLRFLCWRRRRLRIAGARYGNWIIRLAVHRVMRKARTCRVMMKART